MATRRNVGDAPWKPKTIYNRLEAYPTLNTLNPKPRLNTLNPKPRAWSSLP
jgi:hypothetical protein